MTATTWVDTSPVHEELVDVELIQGMSLAMAQATIQLALKKRRISRADLAKRMGRQRSFVTRMMSGGYNMTIKTFALALASCAYRPTFGYAPITWVIGAESERPILTTRDSVPAGAGTFLPALATPLEKCSLLG
jgi:transcriptional regulator with XRE-family HTH domain